jgi:hypothetical protein
MDDGNVARALLHTTRHGFVPVVDIVRRWGHHDAGVVFLQNPRQLVRHALGRPCQVIGQRDVQGRVEDHGHELCPPRRLFELSPAPFPLAREAQAGEHADDVPSAIEKVQERARTAEGLVIGVGGDVDDRG